MSSVVYIFEYLPLYPSVPGIIIPDKYNLWNIFFEKYYFLGIRNSFNNLPSCLRTIIPSNGWGLPNSKSAHSPRTLTSANTSNPPSLKRYSFHYTKSNYFFNNGYLEFWNITSIPWKLSSNGLSRTLVLQQIPGDRQI